MSDLSGVYSLRGFLYQMQLFELLSFKHGWEENDEMIYEGLDDIDSGKTTLISTGRKFVQIKSGQLTKNIYYGVLSNWLLLDGRCPNSYFTLIYEYGDDSKYKSDSFFDDYYNYISSKNMKANHPNCKHSKVCQLFSSKENLKTVFTNINSRITFSSIKANEIYSLLLDEADAKSIKNEMMAKAFVFHFIDSLHRDVEKSILESSKFKLTKKKYYDLYNSTLLSVQNKKYVFKMKDVPGVDYSQLFSIADNRFLNEIKSVSEQESFLIQNIIDEIEYEIFKSSYDDNDSIDKIESLESCVHSRYMILLGNPNIKSNWDFYEQLIGSTFYSDVLEMDYRAKTGCCNYLTSSKASPSNVIKWDNKNE